MIALEGTCAPRFAALRDAFAENFARRNERGAAVAVWQHGELVVDLWGGSRDASGTMPWSADTMVCMMSVAKAITALLVHVLVDRGQIDLDRPVAEYWPDFGAMGKTEVLVRHVLDHRAAIPAISEELAAGAVFDWKAMTAAVVQEPLRWPAGAVPAYHPVTMGFVAGELVRSVTGRMPGEFLRDVTSGIDGFDYYIGVPSEALARCAEISGDYGGTIFGVADRTSLAFQSIAPIQPAMFNTTAFRRSEIPSINGHGTSRAVAVLFGLLAQCHAGHRSELVSSRTLARATQEQWHAVEQTSFQERRMALGFLLGGVAAVPIPGPRGFGHGGAGGALAFADPDHELGFAYGPSHLHGGKDASPRTAALVRALMRSLR